MKKKSSLYEDLGVSKDASEKPIKSAFKQKAKETHPDTAGGDGGLAANGTSYTNMGKHNNHGG